MDSMRALSSAEIQSHLSALFDPHSESSSFEEALEKYIQVASPLSQNSTATPGGAKGAGLQSNGIEEMLSALNNSVASHSGSSHGSGHSHSEGSNANSPASFGRPASALASHVPSGPPAQQQSLEGALAALGESGRQQLLAILQLANAAPSSTTPNAASASTQQQHHHFPNTGDRNLPAKASHQNLAALTMPEGMKQGSSSTGSSRSSNGRQSNPPSSINPYLPGYAQNPETSPVYYANAFTQYVSPTNGNSSSSQTYSRPGSVQASPALGPTSGGQFPYEQDQGQQQSHSSAFSRTASVNEVQYGSMDGQDYRSPRMAPGTSSSAFYSENGNGDESDVCGLYRVVAPLSPRTWLTSTFSASLYASTFAGSDGFNTTRSVSRTHCRLLRPSRQYLAVVFSEQRRFFPSLAVAPAVCAATASARVPERCLAYACFLTAHVASHGPARTTQPAAAAFSNLSIKQWQQRAGLPSVFPIPVSAFFVEAE